jgi:carboxyl-terminal processing protease
MLPTDPAPVAVDPPEDASHSRSEGTPRRGVILFVSIAFVAVMAGSGLFLSGYSLGARQSSTPGTSASDAEVFAPFWEAYHAIVDRYAGGEVDRESLVEGATRGLFDALDDPYSEYLTSEQYRDSLEGLSGTFEGIGAEIGTRAPDGATSECDTLGSDCRLVIIAPIAGSPAEAAGLRSGDILTAVDGTSVDGMTVAAARDLIRGPKDTSVTVSVERDGIEPFDVTITRDVIEAKEVETRDLAGGSVAYVKVSNFSDPSAEQVATAVKAARDKGVERFVLDLRGNPGGYVTAAQRIASEFIASGPIFWQEDADGGQVATEATGEGGATGDEISVAVLIDDGSASASEIVAAALKETGRGTLVGQKTFGKGTVQVWTELANDAGGFRLTVARWLTPDKHWIHGTGIAPDVEVATPPDAPAGTDPVLDRALEVLADDASDTELAPAA